MNQGTRNCSPRIGLLRHIWKLNTRCRKQLYGTFRWALVGEFAPGSGAIAYPGDQNLAFGMDFPAGSNVILAMHYPVGSLGVTDSTKVHFYFYPDQINNFRQIEISPILINFNFCVPPNQQKTITAHLPCRFCSSLSMYGVFPHMHLIGKSISTYAVLPNNDTAKLINIPTGILNGKVHIVSLKC